MLQINVNHLKKDGEYKKVKIVGEAKGRDLSSIRLTDCDASECKLIRCKPFRMSHTVKHPSGDPKGDYLIRSGTGYTPWLVDTPNIVGVEYDESEIGLISINILLVSRQQSFRNMKFIGEVSNEKFKWFEFYDCDLSRVTFRHCDMDKLLFENCQMPEIIGYADYSHEKKLHINRVKPLQTYEGYEFFGKANSNKSFVGCTFIKCDFDYVDFTATNTLRKAKYYNCALSDYMIKRKVANEFEIGKTFI